MVACIITPLQTGFNGPLLYRDYRIRGKDASLACTCTIRVVPYDIEAAYREMAADDARERDAIKWSEGVIGDSLSD